MSTVAIISEFNPFHNGHAYLVNEAKAITGCENSISIMSGNYVQRGEPALFDKYTRARMALYNGIDICLEIPLFFVLSSAQIYAKGCIDILNSLGVCDYICFGSECGDIDILKDIANILHDEPCQYKKILKEHLKSGYSYASSVAKALKDYTHNAVYSDVLKSPNNILGIEYIKALMAAKSSIIPVTVKRVGAAHDSFDADITKKIASATYIRKSIIDMNDSYSFYVNDTITDIVSEYLEKQALLTSNDFLQILEYLLQVNTKETMKNFNLGSDYLASKCTNIRECHFSSFNSLALALKSKDISLTRINRFLFSMILGITNKHIDNATNDVFPYVRLLGLKRSKSGIISDCSKNGTTQIISKWADYHPAAPYIRSLYLKEISANNIYYKMLEHKSGISLPNEIRHTCIIV